RLAALGSVEDAGRAAAIRRRLAEKRRFARALRRLHRIGPGIYELATPETVVCRCEEVTRAELDRAIDASADVNVVKAFTRATMGLCQGRNCQRQLAALIAARRDGVDVVLLERSELNREASGTNAGSFHFQIAIHQLTERDAAGSRARLLADVRLHLRAARLWDTLEDELDGPLGVHRTGGLMVA